MLFPTSHSVHSLRPNLSWLRTALGVFVFLTAAGSLRAATYTVTTTADSGAGSLRQAVLNANGTAAADTIVFNFPVATDAGCVAATGVCTITLTAEIVITNNGSLTIAGTGANRLTIDGGAGTNRIFYSSSAIFTLSGVTLTGGNSTGAIVNNEGGAIYVALGTATIRGVYFVNNTAVTYGGGVVFAGGTNHLVERSTFSGNGAGTGGGGLVILSTTASVINTSVTGNMVGSGGGGIYNVSSTATIRNATVSGNTANVGGGIYNQLGTTNLGNSIVAGNTGGGNPNISLASGTLQTAGYNLIGNNSGVTLQFGAGNPNGNNDIVGTSGSPVNPLLNTLGNNGGTVPTMSLQPTSPAVDRGSLVAGITRDARGVIRPFDNPEQANAVGGNGADIGAFELQTAVVKGWGRNDDGQLGLGNSTPQTTPQTLTGLSDVTQFGGGLHHSVALRSNGTVVTAGSDDNGELGDGTIGGGDRTAFGAVTGANVVNIVGVSGGSFHSLALRADRTVWAWGGGTLGQLGNSGNTNSATPVQVGAGIPSFNTHVVAISAGSLHSLALTDDGKVWAWGFNSAGQLGDGTGTNSNTPVMVKISAGGAQLSGVIQVSAGENHSAALTSAGAVFVWGENANGQAGNGTIGGVTLFPTQTTSVSMGTIRNISAGGFHTVAINTSGEVFGWGMGGNGQIGDGNPADALTPRIVSGLSNVVRVQAHPAYHTLALQRDGTLFIWGLNSFGQIGNGTNTQQNTPLNISAAAGTGGNLGLNIAVVGTGKYTGFISTLAQISTLAGAGVLRGDQVDVLFPASTVAGTTQIRTFDPTATGLTVPAGYTIEPLSTGYDIATTATFVGTATVCLKAPNVVDQAAFGRLTILHDDDGDGVFDVKSVSKDYMKREVCRSTESFSPFVLAQGLVPTAASATVSGRVLTPTGHGLTNAYVVLTDTAGVSRTTRTSSLGYYHFENVISGETYVLTVASKRYQFAPQVVFLTGDLANVDFGTTPFKVGSK